MFTINNRERIYINRLKTDIDSFLFKFKRQYRAFPLKEVTKLSKIRFKPDEKVKVNGYTYTVKDAIRRMRQTYRKLKGTMKLSYFDPTVEAFKKDIKGKTETEIKKIYRDYQTTLNDSYKTLRDDLWFCLNVLRELNRLSHMKTKQLEQRMDAPAEESAWSDYLIDLQEHFAHYVKWCRHDCTPGYLCFDLLDQGELCDIEGSPSLLVAKIHSDCDKQMIASLLKDFNHNPTDKETYHTTKKDGIKYFYAKLPSQQDVVDVITESVIFDEKTFQSNVEKFGKSANLLFIAGLSGSGKSTLAAKYAKQYHAANIEMDLIEHNAILFEDKNPDEGNRILLEWFTKTYGNKPVKFDVESGTFMNAVISFLKYIIAYAKSHKDKYFVAEGIQLMYMPDNILDMISSYPLIIVGTSVLHSIYQAAKREGKILTYMKSFKSLSDIIEYIRFYKMDERLRKGMKKHMIEKRVIESVDTDSKTELFNLVKDYVKKHKIEGCSMLSGPKTHGTKHGDYILLATLSGDDYTKVTKPLSDGISYNGQKIEFHSCYLPGNVYLYVEADKVLTKKVQESEDINMDEFNSFLEGMDQLDVELDKIENYEMMSEGANLELVSLYKDHMGSIRSNIRSAKKLIKEKKYREAKSLLQKNISHIEKIKTAVKAADDTALEKLIGPFFVYYDALIMAGISLAGSIAGSAKVASALKPALTTKIAGKSLGDVIFFGAGPTYDHTKGIWTIITPKDVEKAKSIVAESQKAAAKSSAPFYALGAIADIIGIAVMILKCQKIVEGNKKLLDSEQESKAWWKVFTFNVNPFRAYIYQIFDETELVTKRLMKKIDMVSSMESSSAVKEAVDEKRLEIYEACKNGVITIEEREELLQRLTEAQVVAESIVLFSDEISPQAQFNKVRLDLYERCERGEITLEEREAMILEAEENIFTEDMGTQPSGMLDNMKDTTAKTVAKNELDKQVDAGKNDIDKVVQSAQNDLSKDSGSAN